MLQSDIDRALRKGRARALGSGKFSVSLLDGKTSFSTVVVIIKTNMYEKVVTAWQKKGR